jgi:ATP-dependent Lhr-like helicase
VTDVVGATPIALFLREHADVWMQLADCDEAPLSSAVLDALRSRGALFFNELAAACNMDHAELAEAIAQLVSAGLVTSDGFAGLRAIIDAPDRARRHHAAGRWTALDSRSATALTERSARETAIETQARVLLRRYGVVFRRLLTRETSATSWRELVRVYRRLEARGEIRGGRFVAGMSGEQFALPDAVERLRETRRTPHDGRCLSVSAVDPLNLAGIVTSGDRVRAIAGHRLVYRDGVPLAVLEGEYLRPLTQVPPALAAEVATALVGRPMPPILSGFVGAISG